MRFRRLIGKRIEKTWGSMKKGSTREEVDFWEKIKCDKRIEKEVCKTIDKHIKRLREENKD